MSYNNYSPYGYSPYFEQNNQPNAQQDQPSRPNTDQAFQAQQYGYHTQGDNHSPYYQSAGVNQTYQVSQKAASQQAAKADDSNPSSMYPPRSTTSDIRTPVYPHYQQYDNVQRDNQGGNDDVYRNYNQDNRYYTSSAAPSNLAYSSNPTREASTSTQTSSSSRPPPTFARDPATSTIAAPEYNTLPLPTISAMKTDATQLSQSTAQSHAQVRQLSNPSQYQVNYASHARPNVPLYRFPSPQQPASRLPKASTPLQPESGAALTRPNTAHAKRKSSNTEAPRQSLGGYISTDATGQSVELISETQVTTVNPSQVFDQAEYQQRKAAELDSAKRKENSQLEHLANSLLDVNRKPNVDAQTSSRPSPSEAKHSRTNSSSREQIQAELRTMIERMRDFKSKDPTGFSEIWEQFKKVQPPPRAISQTPQTTKSPITTIPGHDLSPSLISGDSSSPNLTTIPGHELREAMPDLGKFPFQRRRRKYKKSRMDENAEQTDTTSILPLTSPNNIDPALLQSTVKQSAETNMQNEMRQSAQQLSPTQNTSKCTNNKKTLWPKDKSAALAAVAKKALEAVPENYGKTISTTKILSLFEKDPTYDAWCTMLTNEGFVVHKNKFAKIILSALNETPDQGSNNSVLGTLPKSMSNLFTNPSQSSQTPNFELSTPFINTSLSAISAQLSPQGSEEQNAGITPIRLNATDISKESNNQRNDVSPKIDQSMPLTKGQMARKRDFAEIVDFSGAADSDSEDEVRPEKRQNLGLHNEDIAVTLSSSAPSHPPADDLRYKNSNLEQAKAPATNHDLQMERLRTEIVALPLQHKNARRTSHYNPATLARDLLIAKGEHPTERPLNFHLMGLVSTFKHVNWNTDLSTFRWDLIDPGEPVVRNGGARDVVDGDENSEAPSSMGTKLLKDRQGVEEKNAPLFQSIFSRGRGRGEGRGSGRGRPRGRARSRLYSGLGRGRVEPSISAKNEEDAAMSNSARQSAESPATPVRGSGLVSRGRVRGARGGSVHLPSAPSFTPVNQPLQRTVHEPSNQNNQDESSFLENISKEYPFVSGSAYNNEDSIDDLVRADRSSSISRFHAPAPAPTPAPNSIKRRGRPPKDRASSMLGRTSSATPSDGIRSSTPELSLKRRGRPPGSKNIPKFSPASLRGPGRPPKPSASRVNTQVPSDGVGIMVPSRSPSIVAPTIVSHIEKRPQPQERKPPRWKARPTYPSEVPDIDAYPTFKCRWHDCPGDLHNLETLGNHVRRIHGRMNPNTGRFPCNWDGCDERSGFIDLSAWESHVEDNHLDALARLLGDGPSTHPSEVPPSTYLSDATGRQITPLARTTGTPDPLPLNAGRSPTRAYHKAHGNVTPEQKAEAEAASSRTHRLRAQQRIQEEYRRSVHLSSLGASFGDSTIGDGQQHNGRSGAFVVI